MKPIFKVSLYFLIVLVLSIVGPMFVTPVLYKICLLYTSAFITLSNSWNLKGINYFKPIAIFLAGCMLSLVILRRIRFPKVVYEELKNPVTGTFYPTMGMVCRLYTSIEFLKNINFYYIKTFVNAFLVIIIIGSYIYLYKNYDR